MLKRWLERRRWRRLGRAEAEGWVERAAFAAEKLGPVQGVADMGCGWMTLERFLAPGTRYVPIDLVARDDRTIVCDFNEELPPDTGMPAVACLGLLGYLHRPDFFMAELSRLHGRAFVTYKATDAPGRPTNRRKAGLVTDLSASEAERMFVAAGWRIEDAFWNVRPAQVMWLLSA
jgi:hypothetical protein